MFRLKQLFKDSVVYGLGGILAKGIGFFLLPVYTRIFTPQDYGYIELIIVISSLLSVILNMGLDSTQSFFFYKEKQSGKKAQSEIISSILQCRLIWGSVVVLFASCLSPFINAWFFNSVLPLSYFAISFAGALFSTILNQSVEIYRLLYRPWPYLAVTLANTVLAAGLILTMVMVFELGIYGFFLGSLMAAIVITIVGWFLVREYLDFSRLHWQWWPQLLKYGAPLLPAGLAFYAMSTADRWFIQYYHGSEALGIYAVGAKFALIMGLVIQTFRKAWWPIAMDAMHSEDGPETFRMIARLYMGLGVASVVYLTFLSPWLVTWMTGKQFHNAYPVVGILAWQSLFYGFFMIGTAGIWKVEKTYITAILMVITGILNILLNYFWVPEYGGMGAALATAVAYFFWNILLLIVSEYYWRVGFPVFLMIGQIGIGSVAVAFLIWGSLSFETSIILTHIIVALLLASSLDFKLWRSALMKGWRLFGFA